MRNKCVNSKTRTHTQRRRIGGKSMFKLIHSQWKKLSLHVWMRLNNFGLRDWSCSVRKMRERQKTQSESREHEQQTEQSGRERDEERDKERGMKRERWRERQRQSEGRTDSFQQWRTVSSSALVSGRATLTFSISLFKKGILYWFLRDFYWLCNQKITR